MPASRLVQEPQRHFAIPLCREREGDRGTGFVDRTIQIFPCPLDL